MRGLALLLAVAALPASAEDAAPEGASCIWTRVSPRGAYDGPCDVRVVNGGLRVTAGLREFEIREHRSVGSWSLVSFNGVEAMRFDGDPTHASYATVDLNETLGIVR